MNSTRKNGDSKTKGSTAKDAVKETAAEVSEKAGKVAHDVRDQASELSEQALTEAKGTLGTRKTMVAEELSGVASALRQTGQQLRRQDQAMFARYSQEAASQIERASSYLEDHDLDDIVHETEAFARRQPELYLGGAFTLGLLAARFLKSSAGASGNRYADRTADMGSTTVYEQAASPQAIRTRSTEEIR